MNKMTQWFFNRKANEQSQTPAGISRRQFLKVGLVAAAATALVPSLASRLNPGAAATTAAGQVSSRNHTVSDGVISHISRRNPNLASLAINGRPFLSF